MNPEPPRSSRSDLLAADLASKHQSEASEEEPRRKIYKVSSPSCKAVQYTELHDAIRENNMSSVRDILLRNRNLVDVRDRTGSTVLHIAAWSGKEMVKILLTGGANSRIQSLSRLETPLHWALRWSKNDVAEVLVDWDAGGTSNDLRDDFGRTPLYWAAYNGCTAIVKKLVAAGANTHLTDPAGRTPLHVAIYYNKPLAANALIDCGAVNDLQNKDGRSPLHFAALEGYVEICERLLAAGCNAHLRDHTGASPLHLALQNCKGAVASALVDQWANVVRKLLFCDVHPHTKDNDGAYPLETALKCRNRKILKMILAACSLKGVTINWEELKLRPHEIQSCFELLSKHEIETQRMKITMVPGSAISYHDLAKGRVSTSASYLHDEHIQKILSCENAMEDFPNYSELIAFKMQKARDRKNLADQFLEVFFACFRNLPPLCINIILCYLNNQDLKNFVEAFKFIPR